MLHKLNKKAVVIIVAIVALVAVVGSSFACHLLEDGGIL